MKYLLAIPFLLSGCVSLSHLQRKQEESYHKGRREVIDQVSDWFAKDFSKRNMNRILGAMKSGEELWEIYFYKGERR